MTEGQEKPISQCLKEAEKCFAEVGDSARIEAELLVAWALEKDRAYLFTWPERILTPLQLEKLEAAVKRRSRGEPMAYILGEQEFWSLKFSVEPCVLVPRADTEILVEMALQLLPKRPSHVLDLGTGSGAVAIALAFERPDCFVEAVDNSNQALTLAEGNRQRHNIGNLKLIASHWFEAIFGRYDVIVSNPPYIDAADPHLVSGNLKYEPHSALCADDGGIADIRTLVVQALDYLRPGGWLVLEHGWQQKSLVQELFKRAGFKQVTTIKDYGGNDRVTYGRVD